MKFNKVYSGVFFMLYDRKIKYLDYCENGERVRGGGFAKVEVRNGSIRIELNVTGLHPTDSFDREVLLLDGREQKVLGNMAIVGGKGQYLYLGHDLEDMGGTGIAYEELKGIRIPLGAGREISCALQPQNVPASRQTGRQEKGDSGRDTIPFRIRKEEKVGERETESTGVPFGNGKEGDPGEALPGGAKERGKRKTEGMESGWEEERNQEPRQKAERQKEAEEWREDEVRQSDRRDSAGAERQNEPKEKVEPHKEREGKTKVELRSKPEEWRGESGEERQSGWSESREITREAEVPELTGASRHGGKRENEKPILQKEDKWAQLWSIYPHIHPFQDEREYLSIRPSDFVLFPEASYKMVNNSFLLHGYYNYHHLLLNRVERRGEVLYYIGVPGNFYEREKQVAIMFGFESFECAEEPAQAGDFGYYMMRTQL